MRSTIDSAGRVVIPKALRDRLGLGRARRWSPSTRRWVLRTSLAS